MSEKKTKLQLYQACLNFIENRFQTVQNTINEIQESLLSETKSSAGDKHETGRAMLQLEREKAGNQLAEIEKIKQILSKVNIQNTHKKVAFGSLVHTTKFNYFIAISVGEVMLDNEKFYAISSSTPIAKLLLTKSIGDKIQFLNDTFVITKIE
ncbi:MAG: 3-oxoacyl-ACP synthase [Flaviramulus sp.]|nr:3-oxoacyl-ACP synthase [Flaviramulus sp.]